MYTVYHITGGPKFYASNLKKYPNIQLNEIVGGEELARRIWSSR